MTNNPDTLDGLYYSLQNVIFVCQIMTFDDQGRVAGSLGFLSKVMALTSSGGGGGSKPNYDVVYHREGCVCGLFSKP